MTEQDIVDYLKKNRTKGVAFGFMPKEVQEWCKSNEKRLPLQFYTAYEKWDDMISHRRSLYSSVDTPICLPDSFKPKKIKSGWIDFDIGEDGCFEFKEVDDLHSYEYSKKYDYLAVREFLLDSKKGGWNFTAFGGWMYPGSKIWDMSLQVMRSDNNSYHSFYYNDFLDVQPAIPFKIRFWREYYEE